MRNTSPTSLYHPASRRIAASTTIIGASTLAVISSSSNYFLISSTNIFRMRGQVISVSFFIFSISEIHLVPTMIRKDNGSQLLSVDKTILAHDLCSKCIDNHLESFSVRLLLLWNLKTPFSGYVHSVPQFVTVNAIASFVMQNRHYSTLSTYISLSFHCVTANASHESNNPFLSLFHGIQQTKHPQLNQHTSVFSSKISCSMISLFITHLLFSYTSIHSSFFANSFSLSFSSCSITSFISFCFFLNVSMASSFSRISSMCFIASICCISFLYCFALSGSSLFTFPTNSSLTHTFVHGRNLNVRNSDSLTLAILSPRLSQML